MDNKIKELIELFEEIKKEINITKNENANLKKELEMYKNMYENLSELVYGKEKKR